MIVMGSIAGRRATGATQLGRWATARSIGLCMSSHHPRGLDPETRAYLQRKEAEGKTRMEAMRCLKRHLARRYYRCSATDQDTVSSIRCTVAFPKREPFTTEGEL